MLCSIYKSPKKLDTYLYIPFKSSFEELPKALMKMWGEPELVMHLDLNSREKLSTADIDEVKAKLEEEGYYLQMPLTQAQIAEMVAKAK